MSLYSFPNEDQKFRVKKILQFVQFCYSSDCHSSMEHIAKEKKKNKTFCQIRGDIKSEIGLKRTMLKCTSQTNLSGTQFEHVLSFYILIKFSSYAISIYSCI